MMADYGPWMMASWWSLLWLWLLLAVGLWLTVRVLRKAGVAPWWALLLLVPFLYVIGIWVFAFARWPRLDRVHVTPPSDYAGGWNIPDRPTGREDDQPPPGPTPDPRTGRSWDNERRR